MNQHGSRKLARQLLLWLVSLGLCTTAYAQAIEWLLETGKPDNEAAGIALQDGNVCVAGEFEGGAVVGQTYVRCYDADGNELWTSLIYLTEYNLAKGIAADSTGIYIAGTTGGGLPGQPYFGLSDAFVRKYDAEGNALWTDQFGSFKSVSNVFGSDALDGANGVAVDATGVYVVGTLAELLPGGVARAG